MHGPDWRGLAREDTRVFRREDIQTKGYRPGKGNAGTRFLKVLSAGFMLCEPYSRSQSEIYRMFRRVFSRNASRKSCQNFVMSCHVSCFEIVQEEPIRIRSFLFENAAIIYSERAFAWKDGDSFDFFLLFFFCSLGQCSKDSIVSRGN